MIRTWALGLLVTAALGAPAPAQGREPLRPAPARTGYVAARRGAAFLSEEERAQLLAGDTVSRPMVIERGEGRYVGGVSYQLVRSSPEQVLAALASPRKLPFLLPRTKSARLVGVDSRGARIELCQGTALFDATYTVRLHRVRGDELRFALDPSAPHAIRDVWGYVRARPFGNDQSLVTVAVALDLGPGMVRALFEERIQRVILGAPRQIREYFEPRVLARAAEGE